MLPWRTDPSQLPSTHKAACSLDICVQSTHRGWVNSIRFPPEGENFSQLKIVGRKGFARTGPAYVSTPKHPWILQLARRHSFYSFFWLYCNCVSAHLQHTYAVRTQSYASHVNCTYRCNALQFIYTYMHQGFQNHLRNSSSLVRLTKNWVPLSPSVSKFFMFKKVAS